MKSSTIDMSQFALLAGIAVGIAHKADDEEGMRLILGLPGVREIARDEPDRLLAQMMLSRGMSLEGD
jgi:hypothetical protein